MNHAKLIQRFLAEKRDVTDLPEFGFPFVTISRQAGAGGHLLSYIILTELQKEKDTDLFQGWHVFDRALCEAVAANPATQDSMETLMGEKYRSEFREFMESLFTGRSAQYLTYKTTFRVVRMLSLIGKVILVGRCGSLVTPDLQQGIHIRLVAPEALRVIWMMKRFKLGKEEARELMAKQDADRRKVVKMFFRRDIEDPLLYDVVWNTGTMNLEMVSANVIELIRQRAKAKGKLRNNTRYA